MKLEPGYQVKIMFRNGTSVEGIIYRWEEDEYVLRSVDGESILYIQDPVQDIMAIKVIVSKQQEHSTNTKLPLNKMQDQIEEIAKNIIKEPNDRDNKIRTLAELKIAQAEAERKIISEKLKDHHIGETRKVAYGLPGFFKKPSAE